jgi:hypothetical protein
VNSLVRRLRDAWDGFWFGPEAALNLAAARMLVCTLSLWVVLSRDYAAISGVGFVWQPTPATTLARFLIFPGHPAVERLLQWGAIVALIGGITGVAPRASCFVAGLLLYHLGSFELAFRGAVPYGRGLTIAPAALLLLAASPSDHALTLGRRGATAGESSGDYGWSLKLIQLLVCQIYLFSAWGKLLASGLAWGSADSMRLWLLWANVDPTASTFRTPGLWLAEQPRPVLAVLGAGTLALEWGFIVVLFWRRARAWVLPATLIFHVVLLLTINAHVPEVWLLLVFVDWDAWRRRWVRFREVPA